MMQTPRTTAWTQGCIELSFRGRGQLVPGTAGLIIRGQAVPAPFSSGCALELDAALAWAALPVYSVPGRK